jgi:CubicO group peptidase (beta-lactamase class C family)
MTRSSLYHRDHRAMGRRLALGLFGAAPLLASGALAGPAAAATDATESRAPAAGKLPPGLLPGGAVDQLISQQAAQDLFSGTVLLASHGEPVLVRSYGLASKALSIPNGPDTVFGLASITKAFTGVAVTQLAQRGKLGFADTLGAHLAGFPPEVADTVTIHQLLTHTSGMGDYLTDRALQGELGGFTSAAQEWDAIMAVIEQQPLLFPPGTRWSYSNSGFFTLGAIVAQVSGQSYYDYVRQNIFSPAGMASTGFYTKPELLGNASVAHPYATQGQNGSGARYDFLDSKYAPFIGGPDGGGWSTAPDMLRFARALWQRRLLDPAFTGIATSAKAPLPAAVADSTADAGFYCYGLGETVLNYQRIVWHNGGGPGISTDFDTYPDLGWVAIRLENYDTASSSSPIDTLIRDIVTTNADAT